MAVQTLGRAAQPRRQSRCPAPSPGAEEGAILLALESRSMMGG